MTHMFENLKLMTPDRVTRDLNAKRGVTVFDNDQRYAIEVVGSFREGDVLFFLEHPKTYSITSENYSDTAKGVSIKVIGANKEVLGYMLDEHTNKIEGLFEEVLDHED